MSPDGKYVVTANTLTSTITIVDTTTDQVVKMLLCDLGCHGVQFGAKKDGGYYAYVANKFSNRMQVVDMDGTAIGPGAVGCGDGLPCIAGTVLLTEANKSADYAKDETVSGLAGMGGQGTLAVPNVYNGWVQKWVSGCETSDCDTWRGQLTEEQEDPNLYP